MRTPSGGSAFGAIDERRRSLLEPAAGKRWRVRERSAIAVELGLNDKTALVLAGGGGLGAAIAASLAAEGARVAVADLDEAGAARTAQHIDAAGGAARSFGCDLGDMSSLEALVSAVAVFGPISVLVNVSGGPPPTTAEGVAAEIWEQQFRSMVLGVIKLTDLVLPQMRAERWGRVVTSTSSGAIAPIPGIGISNSLRSALLGWSKTLAGEVARDGITVNVVVPGRIATRRVAELDAARAKRTGRRLEDIVAESESSIPIGRYGDPNEYAAAVTFLASVAASYITGTVLRVDGGLIASI